MEYMKIPRAAKWQAPVRSIEGPLPGEFGFEHHFCTSMKGVHAGYSTCHADKTSAKQNVKTVEIGGYSVNFSMPVGG